MKVLKVLTNVVMIVLSPIWIIPVLIYHICDGAVLIKEDWPTEWII